MKDLREAAQRALEALENDPVLENANNNATAWLRAALVEDRPADTGKMSDHIPDAGNMVKPVAYIHESGFLVRTPGSTLTAGMKLYTAPPKREPLTEEEIIECVAEVDDARLAGPITALIRAVERKLGIGGEE